MSDTKETFIKLLDILYSCAERTVKDGRDTGKEWYVSNGTRVLKWASDLKDNANNAIIPSGGSTLGLSRDLGEWAPDYLYKAGSDVDDYYLTGILPK